ncbi:PIG-L deacetylase family protein [Paenibacillus agricola]|uniref:PIG-L family deacetylase n=1 Tax=Paenibacillus agricola TaxID=2716264 RepID=A0ABX0J8Y3_9BACL|nr:PIG-L family deacetylase [Paenibacillus agricola]NHN31317.1 PIG-L family deacetylase [Paenibacillus agricola]
MDIAIQKAGFIYAHPDDETFLSACLIRQLADQGEAPVLLLATKGDAGKKNGDVSHLTNEQLAAVRVKEMEQAAAILGLAAVEHLGYPDGKLQEVEPVGFVDAIIEFINKHQLEAIFTFPEDGGNFHPDHIAISRMATAAVLSGKCPTVRKLYYFMTAALLNEGQQPSFILDTEPQWAMKAAALRAHQSQILAIHRYFGDLVVFPEDRRYESFVLAHEWDQEQAAYKCFIKM